MASSGVSGGLEPGARSLEKNTLSEEGLVVDKVLGQCGEVRGRYGGIAGRSFEAGCRLAADPMHPSTACMVGSAVAQSDVRRRPGWRCALTASSTDGNGGALGTGGDSGASTGGRGEGDPSPSLHLSSTASHLSCSCCVLETPTSSAPQPKLLAPSSTSRFSHTTPRPKHPRGQSPQHNLHQAPCLDRH